MPYLICSKCNKYYKINKNEKDIKKTCECGYNLQYYNSIGEYIYPTSNESENIQSDNTVILDDIKLFKGLITNLETAVSKIILYSFTELPMSLGKNKVIDVLRGSKGTFIIDNDLYKLDTYSVLSDFSKDSLKKILNTLIKNEFLELEFLEEIGNRPVVKITDKGNEFINNDDIIEINFLSKSKTQKIFDFDEILYQELRELRSEIATEKNLTPYYICGNQPLLEMARKMPTTHKGLLSIKGIGNAFLEKYGDQFLYIIKVHKKSLK
jgi:ATP-dependent DNA helicase RecQ